MVAGGGDVVSAIEMVCVVIGGVTGGIVPDVGGGVTGGTVIVVSITVVSGSVVATSVVVTGGRDVVVITIVNDGVCVKDSVWVICCVALIVGATVGTTDGSIDSDCVIDNVGATVSLMEIASVTDIVAA